MSGFAASILAPEALSLLVRSNRTLGTALVEQRLVASDQVDVAQLRLKELLASGAQRRPSLLGILAQEMKAVSEDDLLQHVIDADGLGLVDLHHYEPLDEIKRALDIDACWATWSVPFDREEDFYFVATAYYLSPAVQSFWEKQYGSQIIWYGTTLNVIADMLDKLEGERSSGRNPSGTRNPFPSAKGSTLTTAPWPLNS